MRTVPTSIAVPTILVVDDDHDTRASIRELFEDRGYHVVVAGNGHEAQAYLRNNPAPACMLLDLWMPIMDGWTLAAEIEKGRIPRVPVVVLTAAEPHWGYPAPLTRVVRKPPNLARLVALVEDAVRGNA